MNEHKQKEPAKRGAKEKSFEQKKHPVTVYITGHQMQSLGGLDKCREIALKSLNTK